LRIPVLDREWVTVIAAVPLLFILFPDRPLMADAPVFSAETSFEREQEYFPGDWSITDTYNQLFSLDWRELYSSRLEIQSSFELEIEDIFRSLDIDEKKLEPTLEIGVRGLSWNLDFLGSDTIDYSNEYNTPRGDSLEFALDLDLEPVYVLPSLSTKTQRLVDTQGFLEDKVEDKFEASTEYTFGPFFQVDLSWKEESTDDRLFDDSDLDSREWDVDLDYNQALSPQLKLDFQSSIHSKREETMNNAGVLLNLEREREVEGAIKLSLEAMPDMSTELEYTRTRELAEERDENEILWSVETAQAILDLGTLQENLDVERIVISSAAEETTEDTVDLVVELAGTPYRYTDYSIKFDLGIGRLDDKLDSANDRDTEESEFDVSITLTPEERFVIDTSYNWSVTRENGVETDAERTLKLEGTFDGEIFQVPNLTITPLLEISRETEIGTGEEEKVYNLELDFLYTWILPKNLALDLNAIYRWEKNEDLERELEFTSELTILFPTPSWEFSLEGESTLIVPYDIPDPTVWTHDYAIGANRELTPTVYFDTEYRYNFIGDDQDSDELEFNLEWVYRSASLSVSALNERVFEGPKEVIRTYEAEFSVTF